MSAIRRLFAVTMLVSMLIVQPAASVPSAAQTPAETPQPAAPVVAAPVEPAAQPAPAATNVLADAVRTGKWPAQVAASTGAIRPDQHGPQRTDPAEGIPTHAYSPFDERRNREYPCPPGGCEFMKGQVLVKLAPDVAARKGLGPAALTTDLATSSALAAHGVTALEPIFPDARPPAAGAMAITPDGDGVPLPDLTRWYRATLRDATADVNSAVESLSQTPGIALAEPDYLRKPVGELRSGGAEQQRSAPASAHASSPSDFTDPLFVQQWHLAATNVPQAWQWLSDHGLPPGGNRDIIVAVIDTGVDYNHPDLAVNIWTNSREIVGNGIDDDGNGYVDDVHGADMITNSGSPLDDHGHGTHVAGIIAAQAGNGIGGVGVAYNVQVMAIKAAQYSGVLASSDIAEGINYAVAQGADVINMSFGGYSRSQVEEDALAVAFSQAVLVAAAGNDGKVNLPCPFGRDMYPAAYNWVLGVMARQPNPDAQGDYLAGFSNYDCAAQDSHEYELMAPGADVWSTLPNGQYAAWDGTSMAAPVVSGIAALARTKWSDKDVYSSRFIMGQIATTGGLMQGYTPSGGSPVSFNVSNALLALTTVPQPKLSYLEHWIFDTTAQATGNDNDGIVDAGETIDLGITIRNHWGKADNVQVTLAAVAGVVGPDPYVTMITGTVDYGAVGSFNIDDNGLIYDAQGVITGVRNPFRFRVAPNTPNDHVIPFRLTMVAGNGYDPADPNAPYTFTSGFYLLVQRGRELPRIISQDMTLTKDYYWLVPDQTLIEAGTKVTVTEGSQIQLWTSSGSSPYSTDPYPRILVSGELTFIGTVHEPVELFLSPFFAGRLVKISEYQGGSLSMQYVNVENPSIQASRIEHSAFYSSGVFDFVFFQNGNEINLTEQNYVSAQTIRRSRILDQGNRRYGQIVNSWFAAIFHLNYAGTQTQGSVTESLIGKNWMNVVLSDMAEGSFVNNVLMDNTAISPSGGMLISKMWLAKSTNDSCDLPNNIRGNAFLNPYAGKYANEWVRINSISGYSGPNCLQGNFWGTEATELIDAVIWDRNDDFTLPETTYQPILMSPLTTTYPFVADVRLSTAAQANISALNGPTPIVGAEPVTFTITFNRDMDPSIQPQVSFGPAEPPTDFTVHGGWTDARTWAGAFNITPVTGDGYQLIRVAGARAADDPWLVTGDDAGRFRFEIITSGTESMNLQATGGEGRVSLTWTQDDFDLLSGFNLYRATTQDGDYSRINTSIIPPASRAYTDTAVTPGQPYYYKFTVVKSDMTKSDFSNVATATPLDTIPPVLNHTPVTSAAPGLPLTLSADVTDNVSVQDVILHYRAAGATPYTSQAMVHTTGNRYSATISGAQVVAPGIEYYIEATDGISTVRHGRPEAPNVIAVVDRPVVTAASPNRGPASGGTAVTIAGSNFKADATATVGGAACGSLVVLSANQITCATPPHFPAAADVTVTNPDTQSGSLLRGFTYDSDTASLSLPATGGEQGAIVQVPINAANVSGLAAASLTVTFDPAVLRARAAATGSLTPGWGLVANTATAGQIRLSMASAGGAVSGSGVLAYIEFEVIGAAGTSSALTLASVSLNSGAIAADTAAGFFAVAAVYSVAGTVHFWNGGAGVPGVALTLAGDRLYAGLSAASGAYTVGGARADDYTLTPGKSDGAAGISAYDAALALQHDAWLINLTGYAFTAGDVDKSGAVDSMDAFYILQQAVDLITLPFPGAGAVWTFNPASRSYSNLDANQTGQDFTAVLLGDISGNWSAVATGAGTSGSSAALALLGGRPDAAGFVTARLILTPGADPVHSLELNLAYDASAISVADVSAGPAAAAALMQTNLAEPGMLRLALASAAPLAVNETPGIIATLRFRLPDPATRADLTLQAGSVNEGAVALDWHGGPLRLTPLYLPLLAR